MHRSRLGGVIALVSALMAGGLASAEQIKLQDGTEFSGSILGRDGDRVVISLPRASVASVGGEALPAPVTTGAKAPDFSVTDLSGTTQSLGASKGEATLVHFWASWCPHCRSDVKLMKDLFARYQGKGLRIVTISIDQDVSKLTQFVKDQQIPYSVISAYQDPRGPAAQLPEMYEAQGVPAYYLVDAQGVVAKTFSGSVAEGGADLEGDLQKLMAAAPKHGG